MKLYITRHGETEWNLEKRWQGRHNSELTENGIDGAEALAQVLLEEKIDLIISSPMKRTTHTTEIINKNRNIPVIFDDRLLEICCGDYEGKLKKDIIKTNAERLNAIRTYPFTEPYPNGESLVDVFNRAKSFIQDISKKYADKNVLVVSHGAFIICLYNYLKFGKMLEWSNVGVDNCSFSEFEMCNGEFREICFNDTSHIKMAENI